MRFEDEADMPNSRSRKGENASLGDLLGLGYAPIAIGLGRVPPPNIPRLEGEMEFCRMWLEAQRGKVFFATAENHSCLPGMYHLGLCGETVKEAVCRFWVEQVSSHSRSTVEKYIASLPHLKREQVNLISMSPLEKATFEPDLVLVRCNPEEAMLLLWAYSYNSGEVVHGETGTAACSTLVVKPYLNKKPSFTIGDPGARSIVGLGKEEVVVSVPYCLCETMVKTLESHIQDWRA
jgi:uncharacterized protein (DUF169 family)